MTKLELKIPQPGVTFYGNRRLTTVTILDIKVDDGVKEVFFEGLKDCDAIEVKIQSDCRCPSVERLYISENVRNISISNNTFPNVNRVNSDSKYFLSGNVLIEHYDVQDIYILKNTFCKKKGENIDLKNVNRIKDYAFMNCCSGNVTNIGKTVRCDYKAFFNYNGINLLPVVDGAHMMGNIMMTVSNTIPACTTAINRYIDFSGRNVKLTNPGIVSNIYPAHMPKRIYVDNERIISPDEIYTAGNTSIENIDINPKNKYYTSIDGIVYTADKKTLIRCPVGKSGKVVIPDGVTTIGRHAFRSCKISEVVIPDSVTEIGISAFTESHIQDFTLGKGMTYIGKYMFSTCKNIKHIHIPSHIKEIMSSAFSACNAEDIVLDEGVERIGLNAFEVSTANDTKIILPSSVKMIGDGALRNIKNVTLTNKIPPGFFMSLDTYESGADIYVKIRGKQYILPSQSHFQTIDDYVMSLPFDDQILWRQFKYITEPMERYEFIMRAYKAVDGDIEEQSKKEMLDMLRDNQEYIINNYCKYRYDVEDFIFMLSLDICTKQTIEKIISLADKTEGLSLKAYALDALNRMDTKTDFEI
jgi:hypothetical protein